ncbi:MAG: hypothetical protein IKD90_10780 [Clostridiales bacterium]|nr:hypothetical protein [Clostridiales bacterium]
MKALLMFLRKRLSELKQAEKKACQEISELPVGRLRVSNQNGFLRFYHVNEKSDLRGKYIKKDNTQLARELAQKDYNLRLIKSIEQEKKAIEIFLKSLPKISPEDTYTTLAPARKEMVQAMFMEGEDYARWWLAQPYIPNPSFPEEKIYATKRGEFVRSKAEAMIADSYYDMRIPYKYDYPVEVEPGRYRYADFATLDVRNGKVFYHEHLGRLDDPKYIYKNLQKIKEYQQINVFSGKNLILTLETEEMPLDMNLFRKNTAELFGIEIT